MAASGPHALNYRKPSLPVYITATKHESGKISIDAFSCITYPPVLLANIGIAWVIEGLLAKLEQVMPAVGNPERWPSTSNAAEWFFIRIRASPAEKI